MKQKRQFGILGVILFLLIIVGSNGHSVLAERNGSIDRVGLIDLSHEAEAKAFYAALNGEWYVFDESLLNPIEVREQLNDGYIRTVSIPSSFEAQTGLVNSYATYSVMLRLPQALVGETLAIHVPYQYSAYKLYVDDIELIGNGTVGHDAATHVAEMAPRTGYFIAQSDEVQLTMQVSSFDHIRGGFENVIYVGEASVVAKNFNTSMVSTLFLNGSVFIIGLFMVLFAFYRRREQLFLIFGLFAMLIAVRALFAVPFYYTLLFIDMSWLWGTRLEYILTEATSMFYVILLWKWHEKEFSRKIMQGLVVIHVALMVTTLLTQPVFFQALFFNVFYLAVPTLIYTIYVSIKSIRKNNVHAKANLVGMSLIFVAFFNDFAIGQGWYKSVTLMLPAVGAYVVIHVVLMSKGFAESIRQTERQNKQLLALNDANEELAMKLQKENKRKDDFLANTSHELRNPLHGLINIAQSILHNRSRQLDDKTRQDLELQLTIGHHMSQTLEDLLDITRLKEHTIQLRKERLNIQAVAVGVVDMFKVLIENKPIRLDVQIPSDFPSVIADKNRLIQILFNLVHNAVKYTEQGMIAIAAEVKGELVHIHVSDTGIGMDEKLVDTIFEPYEQGDSSMIAMGGGLGLGLSICQQLLEMHGGDIKVSSSLGEGSVFTFTLPLADDSFEEQVAAASEMSSDGSELTIKDIPATIHHSIIKAMTNNVQSSYRPKVLAVDDDPVNLQVLTNILSEDRYDIVTVTSSKAALQQLERQEWDLVISDVMMPNMSGYDLTRAIRETFSISELPILLLTARSHPEDIYTGFIAGANDYVTKPVDAIELNVRVHALTDLQASIRERLELEAAWLQAQIRPHFMLNTINAIVSLSEIDATRMTSLLEHFAHYLQSSFYFKNLERLVSLETELELVESYLFIEKERFGDRLHIHWDIDDVRHVMVPPLSIQTLVENAVNHGVLKRVEGGTITIQIHHKKSYTEIAIIDDGVGMDEQLLQQTERRKGIGLFNTEQRLKRLYGKGLRITSTVGKGTTIAFTVPASRESD